MLSKRLVFLIVTITLLVAGLINGCGKTPDKDQEAQAEVAVNDENCTPENIIKVKDKASREKLSSKCAHRGEFKPSPARNW